MNLYAYCLSDEVTLDMIGRAQGLADAQPRLIEHESLKAVVSDFPAERAQITRENVLAHESVIHRVLARTTPLPFRFGAVTTAARLESYVSSHRAALLAQLSRVRGSVEMSVKIIWDEEAFKRAAAESTGGGQATRASETVGPGAAFLAAKRREVAGDESLRKEAQEIARRLEEVLRDVVRESYVRVRPTKRMAVAASHLVARERLDEYHMRVAQARDERRDLRFLTSGAWPPYSFSELSS